MRLSDAQIQALHRRATRRPQGRPDACPAPERLVEAATGEPEPRAERVRLARHLAGCSDCSTELRLVRELLPERRAAVQMPRRWTAGLALCAASLLVALGLSYRPSPPPGPPPGQAERGQQHWLEALEPADGAVLGAPPGRLAWSAARPAERFEVVLYDFEATPLWRSGPVPRPSAVLTPEARAALVRGRRYFWRVQAESGIERRAGPLFSFELEP